MEDYDIAGVEGLALHHFYRAMAWLGEELEEKREGALAPRCVKDVIEESCTIAGATCSPICRLCSWTRPACRSPASCGETLGEHGYSKDHRPDLKQMILGLVVDGSGTPICTEMWPGNTADVTVLLPVINRLRQRFGIGRVCIVADRGMISAETIAELDQRTLDYILGARKRHDALVRKIVLANEGPLVPLLIERRGRETQLFAKEVKVEGKRYIVCRNEAEAEKGRNDREAIVTALEAQLKRGDKALVGNSAYRRYLRKTADGPAFAIDAGKLAEEARFDGIFVLRTNAKITPLQAVLRYRDLLQVENLFLQTKAVMRTAADLPFLRRRDTGPRVLFFPRARHAEVSGRPVAPGWHCAGMEDAAGARAGDDRDLRHDARQHDTSPYPDDSTPSWMRAPPKSLKPMSGVPFFNA